MDDELEKLEAELRRLRPVAPRAAWRAEIERTRKKLHGRRARPGVVVAWALGIAAGLAVVAVFLGENKGEAGASANVAREETSAKPEEPAFKPVAAEKVVVGSRDEGYVTFADGTPARRVRMTYLDTITWRDARTHASLSWTVPREEIRVVPVSFQ